MSVTVPIAEWLERDAGKPVIAGSISGGGTHFHFEFCAYFSCSQLGEDHTNEIKHGIHPE